MARYRDLVDARPGGPAGYAGRSTGAETNRHCWAPCVRPLPDLDPSTGAAAGEGGGDHDEDRRDDDADDPPDPVDALRRLHAQRGGDVVADQPPTDAAQHGEPEGDVVPVAGSEELAKQPDDDAGDDDTDDFHGEALQSLIGFFGRASFTQTASVDLTFCRC